MTILIFTKFVINKDRDSILIMKHTKGDRDTVIKKIKRLRKRKRETDRRRDKRRVRDRDKDRKTNIDRERPQI